MTHRLLPPVRSSLLQSLFMSPEFRATLFAWRLDEEDAARSDETPRASTKLSIPLQLQRLFAKLSKARPNADTRTDTDASTEQAQLQIQTRAQARARARPPDRIRREQAQTLARARTCERARKRVARASEHIRASKDP
eukprot:53610-Pleurochrysis_carterae.AAC.1